MAGRVFSSCSEWKPRFSLLSARAMTALSGSLKLPNVIAFDGHEGTLGLVFAAWLLGSALGSSLGAALARWTRRVRASLVSRPLAHCCVNSGAGSSTVSRSQATQHRAADAPWLRERRSR